MSRNNRRWYLKTFISTLPPLLAGCIEGEQLNQTYSELDLRAAAFESGANWSVTVHATIGGPGSELTNIQIVGFDQSGTEVCRSSIGDLEQHRRPEAKASLQCTAFPVVITAIANESVCEEDVSIAVLYWKADELKSHDEFPDDASLWGLTMRKCNEELPPERVLEQVSVSTSSD